VLFATFILCWTYVEGKSNYFKGSMLLLAYGVLVVAFWFAPLGSTG
jgi:Ca2+:H+ antiporter